jgi:hypothetical protein
MRADTTGSGQRPAVQDPTKYLGERVVPALCGVTLVGQRRLARGFRRGTAGCRQRIEGSMQQRGGLGGEHQSAKMGTVAGLA